LLHGARGRYRRSQGALFVGDLECASHDAALRVRRRRARGDAALGLRVVERGRADSRSGQAELRHRPALPVGCANAAPAERAAPKAGSSAELPIRPPLAFAPREPLAAELRLELGAVPRALAAVAV